MWDSILFQSTETPRGLELTVTGFESLPLSMLLQTMEENCTLRPCATDFSIAAIMARHDRRTRSKQQQQDSADTLSPLGRQYPTHHCAICMLHDGHYNVQNGIAMFRTALQCSVRHFNVQNGISMFRTALQCSERHCNVQNGIAMLRTALQWSERH